MGQSPFSWEEVKVPIFDQSYRTYDGELRRRFRWWIMVQQELRVLFKNRTFLILLIVTVVHVSLRILQVVAYDILASNPNNPIAMALRSVAMMTIGPRTFFDFLVIQTPLVFLIALLAGSGMICDDFRNNLMEIYFSKPLSWRDYVSGKVMTLLIVGLGITAAPGIGLVLLHNLLAPGWRTLRATWWLPASITAFSLSIVLPAALGVLASSALCRSQRYATIAVFMVVFGNLTFGVVLAEVLHKRNYQILAIPLAINRVGEFLFQRRSTFDLPWGWSALLIGVVCAGALWIVCRKVRQAEVAS